LIFAAGLSEPEGPVALPDGTWLIVEGGSERGCVTQISPDGKASRVVKRTGRPNGLAVDSHSNIWVAESQNPSLLRLTMDGKSEVIATDCDGEPFLFPNDLCIGPDGAIYMTDSGVAIGDFAPNNQIRPDYDRQHYDGRVYRVDAASGKVEKLDTGIKFTNGIAFGPDQKLYVNETLTGNIYCYDWVAGAITSPRVLFGNVLRSDGPAGWRGPDGMAFSAGGDLYVAVFGQGDVTVLGREGQLVKRIATSGILPTNLAFAANGPNRIYVTEYAAGQIEMFDVSTGGLPLYTEIRPLINAKSRSGSPACK
jgi:gluconolactonase